LPPRSDRRVHLNRLLSKRGILTRTQANDAILAGRVSVNGQTVRDPGRPVDRSARIALDGTETGTRRWRTILFYKPRGLLTTRRDPEGRPTIYDLLGDPASGLIPVGRLDQATSGLLLLTTDTALADRITDPRSGIPRVYVLTVRGRVSPEECARLAHGVVESQERLRAASVVLRKPSARETHLTVTLHEGRNREVRRLFKAIGHEVTRLKRVALGRLTLGDLQPGEWRDVSESELRRALTPGAAADIAARSVL
jgi:23S rRNA pseudouridine2605 synthase